MEHQRRMPRAVALIDRAAAGSTPLLRTLDDHGVEVRVVERWTDMLEATIDQDPDLVVLDLAMVGAAGIRVIAMVHAVSPRAAIAAISDLEALNLPALELGANVVMQRTDLRPLRKTLRQVLSSPVDS